MMTKHAGVIVQWHVSIWYWY